MSSVESRATSRGTARAAPAPAVACLHMASGPVKGPRCGTNTASAVVWQGTSLMWVCPLAPSSGPCECLCWRMCHQVEGNFKSICQLCVDIFCSLRHVWGPFMKCCLIPANSSPSSVQLHNYCLKSIFLLCFLGFPQACPDTWRQYHLTVSWSFYCIPLLNIKRLLWLPVLTLLIWVFNYLAQN